MMLEFRAFTPQDQDLLVAYLNDDRLTHFLSARIPQPYTPDSAAWWIETGSKEGFVFAIVYQGTLVGSISAMPGAFEKQRSAEIGYWIAQRYWGLGVASAALEKFTRLMFATTNIERLYAAVFEGNTASERVLQKCGYHLDAVLSKALFKHGRFYNERHYSIVRP